MAASLRWKVYSPKHEYVAACRYIEDAAAMVAVYGYGATIHDGHRGQPLWMEGEEKIMAIHSYDFVRNIVMDRVIERKGE